jgi:ketosteroid isomerase-like protein
MSEESTTPDLVERLRRFNEAFNSRDVNRAITFFWPDATWDASVIGLAAYEGHAAIREFFEEWQGSYAEFSLNRLEEVTALGHGITFAIGILTGRLKGASGELQLRWALVAEWAEGLIARAMAYTDIDEARAAAERLAEERG